MASAAKVHPYPTVLISNPANAGPTTREPVISALLRLTAFWTLASGTISTT